MATRQSDLVDIAIVGGGHNGLVAAAYLARAGLTVVVLEKLDVVGGAAVSAQTFDGIEARLSRYAYLVSLLPARIINDLRLDLRFARRRFASYTPIPDSDRALLVDNADAESTRASFSSIGARADFDAWQRFYERTGRLASALFPTMCEPLPTASDARALVSDPQTWSDFIERPVGEVISETFESDLVRGLVLTDALIGTFAPNVDESLAANRCFMYHVIGGGTGEWAVPVGGMGAVASELTNAALSAGARIITGAEVTSLTPDGEVRYRHENTEHVVGAKTLLVNVAPALLSRLLGHDSPNVPEGAQVKVNLVVSRLPALLESTRDSRDAFGGTFHVNETWSALGTAYASARAHEIPQPLPCEVYCHSLTDPSILSAALVASGAQTLTVFGLHTPSVLVSENNSEKRRSELQSAVLASLNSVLAEPIETVLMNDAFGRPAIETKTTLDLEHSLGMPGGNIFHDGLSWPFTDDDSPASTAAERWGVATDYARILLCGSGAKRGGAVSGIGGHNAAMAVLESL